VVDLVAVPEEGYKFFNWTEDMKNMEIIANVNATSTTKHVESPVRFWITMESDYGITAHFIPR
jgi:hypothetical protein